MKEETDHERDRVINRLRDLAYDVLEWLKVYEPTEPDATYEDVFWLVYGWRFELLSKMN